MAEGSAGCPLSACTGLFVFLEISPFLGVGGFHCFCFGLGDEYFIAAHRWTAPPALAWCFSIRTDVSTAPSASVSQLCHMLCPPFFLFFLSPFHCGLDCTALGYKLNNSSLPTQYTPGSHVDTFMRQSMCRCFQSLN